MGRRTLFCASLFVGVCSLRASAQQLATTVQLPTFSFFTVNTTVVVPDSGGTQLSRLQRAMISRQFFGPGLPGAARGQGMHQRAAAANVSAQVHDLNDGFPEEGALKLIPRPKTATLGSRIARTQGDSASAAAASLAKIRESQAVEETARRQAAKRYIERAEAAASDGKVGAARVYYRLALRHASGALAGEIAAKIASLEATNNDAAVARRSDR